MKPLAHFLGLVLVIGALIPQSNVFGQIPAGSSARPIPVQTGEKRKEAPEHKTLLEVATDQVDFLERPVILTGTLELGTLYGLGYRNAQQTHYSFMFKEGSRVAIVFMRRGEASAKLRKVLLDHKGKIDGSFTIVILKERNQRPSISSNLYAELIDYALPDSATSRNVLGQIPAGSSARSIPTLVEATEARVSQIIAQSEDHFHKGKIDLDDNKRDAARDEFDKAVDTILESGLDVRATQRLQTFYLELVERIYREEVPIGHGLQQAATTAVALNGQAATPSQAPQQIGFREQKFEPSPADQMQSRSLLSAQQARPQDKPNAGRGGKQTGRSTSQTSYSIQAFDPSLTILPPNFRGHDLTALYKLLAEREQKSVKGEFETTETFKRRLSAMASQSLLGTTTQDSVFAFVIGRLESKYDADKQTLHARANLSILKEGLTHRARGQSLLWGIKGGANTYYMGTNSFGAKVRVERDRADFFEIALDNYDAFPIERYFSDSTEELFAEEEKSGIKIDRYDDLKEIALAADLRMNPQSAMKSKTQLRVLIVCRLIAPFNIEGTSYHEPKIDDPKDSIYSYHTLNTDLLEVWFFDASTGQVYARQKRSQ